MSWAQLGLGLGLGFSCVDLSWMVDALLLVNTDRTEILQEEISSLWMSRKAQKNPGIAKAKGQE